MQWVSHQLKIPFTVALGLIITGPLSAGGGDSFTDDTSHAGVDVEHDTSGFSRSNYSGGGTIGDFNRDGFQDLFVFSGGGGNDPDHLFINNGNGTFTDRASSWGLTAVHKGKSACAGDYDGDGWLDLYVTSAGPWGESAQVGHHKLYHNNGDGTFTNVANAAGVTTADQNYPSAWTACFGDYDLDGDLDLYVGGFYETNNNGNNLFRNNGNGTFTNVTQSIGLFSGVGPVANLSSRFVDMDGDRYPELLLGGDFKGAGNYIGSRYFRNNTDGTFTDVTNSSNTGDEENGMGHCVGDFNNDGLMDWYVTSIYFPNIGWTGNKLYRNLGNHNYNERADTAMCDDGGYGWGTVAVDFDHDGYIDIAETNGDDAGSGSFANEQAYLYMNNGGTIWFSEDAVSSGLIHNGKGRGMLNFDYDNDGDQDVVIISNEEDLLLYRNNTVGQPDSNWLRIFLDTSNVPEIAPNGYGAKVRITVDGMTMLRSIDGGTTFLGICELSAHFGLGGADVVDTLVVEWPDGSTTELADVAANQTMTILAGEVPCPADLNGDGTVDGADIGLMLASWDGSGKADINSDGIVDGADMGLLLAAWSDCA